MTLRIVFSFAFFLSFFLLPRVLTDYKVAWIQPEPGHIINSIDAPVGIPITSPEEVAHLPKFFDVREHWPECSTITSRIYSQGSCGACWAVSVADVLSDRLCIASGGRFQERISAYHLLTCCGVGYCADGVHDLGGCRGGDIYAAFAFYDKHGLVTEDCRHFPTWVSQLRSKEKQYLEDQIDYRTGKKVTCQTECRVPWIHDPNQVRLNFTAKLHKGATYYRLPNDETTIRKEIYERGSVAVQFDHREFLNATSWERGEFYFCTKEDQYPTHGVRLIGWGEDEQLGPYWLLANSWGVWWNDFRGLFKIVKGKNMCNLEKFVVAAIPKVK